MENKFFLIFGMIFLMGFVSAFDEQLVQICGGDEQLQILCIGDTAPIGSVSAPAVGGGGGSWQPLNISLIKEIKGFEKKPIYWLYLLFLPLFLVILIIIFIVRRYKKRRLLKRKEKKK